MAIKWPLANGNWSNAANWNDGTLPDVGDDVHADGKTVTIDQNVTVLSIRTTQRSGGTAGGVFTITSGNINITSDVIGGSSSCLNINASGSTTSIIGNVTGSSSSNAAGGILFNSGSVLNIIGNVIGGGTTNNQGIRWISGEGVINITGNINGSNTGPSSAGILTTAFGTINIIGNVIGSNNNNSNFGLDIRAGITNIIGICMGGVSAVGLQITASGICNVSTCIGSNITNVVGVNNAAGQNRLIVENLEYTLIGTPPNTGFVVFKDSISPTVKITKLNTSQITLIDLDNLPNELPIEQDVREGTSYNSGNKTGTLAVPNPSNVRKDVPTDNTVGTADLTAEDILQAIQDSTTPLAERLRNVATGEIVGAQFVAFKNT